MNPATGLPSASSAYQNLQGFSSNRPSVTDYTNQADQQYGVSGLNSSVNNLQSLVGNLTNAAAGVAPSVTGRTAGTFTTEAQRQALVNKEQTPILSELQQQQQGLGTQQSQLSSAETMANQMAGNLMSQDQTKYQGLLDQYNAANAAEQFHQQQLDAQQQAAQSNALEQQKLAEQVREFNNPQKAAATPDLSAELAALMGGQQGSGQPAGAQMQQRAGGGFNFQNSQGQAISAAQYAQLKGVPFRTLLQQMATAGDTGAKTGLNYVGNDYGVNKPAAVSAQQSNPQISSLLNSLLYGVNNIKLGNPANTQISKPLSVPKTSVATKTAPKPIAGNANKVVARKK
jgi:hypothetical protein